MRIAKCYYYPARSQKVRVCERQKEKGMESKWSILIVTFCVTLLLKSIFSFIFSTNNHNKGLPLPLPLPPGPSPLPFIGNLLWLRNSSQFEPILRRLRAMYGPLISLRFGPRRHSLFIASHSLAHRALVHSGALFSDRPDSPSASRIINSNQHNISSASYGPTWRLLRRNLTSEVMHPSRVKSYSSARRWALAILLRRFLGDGDADVVAFKVVDHLRYSMFCLLLLMCFGVKLQDTQIKAVESVLHRLLLNFSRFQILNLFPSLGKVFFRRRWRELLQLRRDQEDVLIPLIRARLQSKESTPASSDSDMQVAYVDTIVDLELPDEKRKPNEGELVSLCSEFLNAGTDTTSTALQWIMANLVKYPAIQARLYQEIVQVVGPSPALRINGDAVDEEKMEVVEEEDLERMPYLKAVVLEGLRRHPPGHFVLPHAVTEDVELGGYLIPKKTVVNFMVAEMGWDPEVWEDPMEFKPERFLGGQAFDVTCSREIKMMPFGAGRRICPGANLALLHLEYFVANFVWYFQYSKVDGDEVDLSEKQEFTTVMKNPLTARISPRVKSV